MTDEQDATGGLAEEARGAAESPDSGAEDAAEATRPVEISYAEYEELKTLARERDEYLQRLQRAVADYQNLQKRIEKFRDAARESVLRSMAEAILPVADSLSLALQAAEQTEGADNIVEGLRLVEKDFYAALEKLDIHPVHALGQPFDPHYHEAVMQQEAEDTPPNTVVRELKKGFMLGEQVIRPSQVIVSGPERAGEGPGA